MNSKAEYQRQYRWRDIEKTRAKEREARKRYLQKNRDKVKASQKLYHEKNKEKRNLKCRLYRQRTLQIRRQKEREYAQKYRIGNPLRKKYQKEYFEKNKEKSKVYSRNHTLKHKYNITVDDYIILFEKQKSLCAICKEFKGNFSKEIGLRPLNVDHNHKTKKIRGLLCRHCNALIGYAKENIENLKNAIEYLEVYNA